MRHLLRQTCAWLDTDSAALFRQLPDSSFYFCLGVGELGNEKSTQLVASLQPGFGLVIVKQVVDAHQGRIEVKRQDHQTRFTLLFPHAGAN